MISVSNILDRLRPSGTVEPTQTPDYAYQNGSLQQSEFQELQAILRAFLSHYDWLHEERFQKLLFYADIYAVDNTGERLTNVVWMPMMYGSFSEDVQATIQYTPLRKRRTIFKGQRTFKYTLPDESPVHSDLSEQKRAIVERVSTRTKCLSIEQLRRFAKDHWLFAHTEYATEMDFDAYRNHLSDLPCDRRPLWDPHFGSP